LQGVGDFCESLAAMPFTFAHPAAILPLRRFRFLQTLPLIIGSMVPDAWYFFPTRFVRATLPDTHTLYGTFTVCVPLGLAALYMILVFREPLTVLLGARARWVCLQSIERFYTRRPLHWLVAILSILIGAWTHLAWDSVTHETGWTAARVEALTTPVSVFGWDTATSHLLQYLSSVFGLTVVAVWFRYLLLRVPKAISDDPTRPRASWLTLVTVSFAALAIGVSRALLAWHGSYYHLEYLLLTRIIAWFVLLYFVAGVVTVLSRRLVPEPAS
jgi:Domain of unknown function (DUF4184)